jgi:hypothetical protein
MKLDPNKISAALSALATDEKTVRGNGPVRRSFGITIKEGTLNEKKRSVRVIASTSAIDSYDERVEQSFRLERYESNPVVLYGHNRVGFLGLGGDPKDTLPIGFATDIEVTDHLEVTLNFVDEKANPMAELVWQGFVQTSIRAVSIGFFPHTVREEKHDDRDIYVLADNELYEISAVPIPANPEAVALSAERNAERAWLKERAHPTSAARAAQENIEMQLSPEQIKKLQDDLAAKETECNTLRSQCGTLQTQVTTATNELAAVNDALTKLEPATDAFKGLDALGKVGVLKKSIDTAKAKSIEAEVDALIGKKLLPAQKADFVALRTNSPESFESIVKGLQDLPQTKETTPPEANPTKSKADSSLGKSKIAAKGKAAAETARSASES